MTTVTKRITYAVDSVDVASFSLPLSEDDIHRAISLTTLKELRAMATISDQALADLQAAAQANADRDALLGGKVDAAIQLIQDLKDAANQPNVDQALRDVTALLNGATAQAIAAEDKLDAAVAPPTP
jgi:hypothetical protein